MIGGRAALPGQEAFEQVVEHPLIVVLADIVSDEIISVSLAVDQETFMSALTRRRTLRRPGCREHRTIARDDVLRTFPHLAGGHR
nr:hypothetical protein GCM10010200_100810 [Actinomadura rugatobispora]